MRTLELFNKAIHSPRCLSVFCTKHLFRCFVQRPPERRQESGWGHTSESEAMLLSSLRSRLASDSWLSVSCSACD